MPAWEKIFVTKKEADAFAKKHRSFGDKIFSNKRCSLDDPPSSMTALIAAGLL